MENGILLYEGKAKRVWQTDDTQVLRIEYKDDATAFNGVKHSVITGKGELNNAISSWIFQQLAKFGIDTHYIKTLSPTEQLVRKVTIVPLEVVVRNVAAGSLVKRLGILEGTSFEPPIIELYMKNDALNDPLVNEDHIRAMELASYQQVDLIKKRALEVNQVLRPLFKDKDLQLVDFKLEFGVLSDGTLLLADEISPDTCRLWDFKTGEKLDKDRFRFELGNLLSGYGEVWDRLKGEKHV